MEGKILVALNINLSIVSPLKFVERYGRLAGYDEKHLNITRYLCELALLEYKMMKYNSSQIACTAMYLINKNMKKETWGDNLTKSCKYTEYQLKTSAKDLFEVLQSVVKGGNGSLQAVKKKYSGIKYGEVAKVSLDKC